MGWEHRKIQCYCLLISTLLTLLSTLHHYKLYLIHTFITNVSLAEKIIELQELLKKKDEEMKVMETRYRKYLEKAKSVSMAQPVLSLEIWGCVRCLRDAR